MVKRLLIFLFGLTVGATLVGGCVYKPGKEAIKDSQSIQTYFTPGADCEKLIIREINNATKIDIAVYSITHPSIGLSIIAAHKNGKSIRIITDRAQAKGKKSLIDDFKKAGIPVLTNKKHKLQHNKFAIFDDVRIVSGSYNWTVNASKYNAENCMLFDQTNKEFSNQFEYLWNLYSK